nr:glycoside hydrolase family protein [Burkholderia cenocepacia]
MPLSEGERIAYTDFTYNAGAANLAASTLLKKVNAGDRVGACHELPRWTCATVEKGKGDASGTCATKDRSKKQLPGLVKRREAAMRACLSSL